MGYLQSKEHDIFVSYAHVDNMPDQKGQRGWVEQFEEQLAVRLLKRFGESIDVWRDPEVRRVQRFDPVIKKAACGSGIMISLVTNRYLKSEYCQQEIDWFREQAEGEDPGLVVDDYLRVFPVLLYNIHHTDWPEVFHGVPAFGFHDAEKEKEFGEPLRPDSRRFQDKLRRLVEELYEVLTRLKKSSLDQESGQAKTDPAEAKSFSVFLAAVADDLGPTRRQLSTSLSQGGITVLQSIPPPHKPAQHAESVSAAVRKADLSIHLLGSSPGEPLNEEDLGKTYPMEQMRMGLDHAQSQLLLMPEKTDVADLEPGEYAKFLNSLIGRQRESDRFEFVQVGKYQMLAEILAKRKKLEDARRAKEVSPEVSHTAFIDLHLNDLQHASDLLKYLNERKITPVMVPSTSKSPTMSLFEQNLRKAGLLIVFFGSVARDWVQHRLIEAQKLILINRLRTEIGVYVAPPQKAVDDITFSPYQVAVNVDHFDPRTINPLLQRVAAASS